ncbi:CRISPR-associated endonuclease Cas1 [Nitratiruptor tergarcus]|uniref:CRISPR-associated endonuclease Cas1 n=1 Tax=Nitratiruptor tergarcus DSM 16512 TaxID=1069081 RepID=A0A1W1WT14_9BACT|nr:CRISPR-associated endonuclease Cas1 [Nitratiruptor tergarcus]SMC09190.1 CRISPR-associated endonuclease Cas1/group II intron reverse transcriptase/maturase,TIGR04416 [Nitratiruptor tergarcus DSM 16512]
MKSYIFNKTFEDIFTKERIAYEAKRAGFDIPYKNFFNFAPHKSFFIPKNSNGMRQISVPDTKAKIIQKILHDELTSVLRFSDRNYAYQKNKSPLKAINRVKHIIKNYEFILKADIKDFFDSIDHDRLLAKLSKIIKDPKIIYLIALFLKNGSLFHNQWIDKTEGVYQGDVLSPLLSNIYLHKFDMKLENENIEFVRFADDMIFFANPYKETKKILNFINQLLQQEKLSLHPDKLYITHKNKPFEYLGVLFDIPTNSYSIENERLMSKISTISKETKNLDLDQTIKKLNEHIEGFLNYYAKIINNTNQLELLQKRADEIIIAKIIEAKQNKTITRKSDFLQKLSSLLAYTKTSPINLVNHAYEQLRLKSPKKAAYKTIEQKKRDFFKNSLKTTELIISKPGTYLSFSQGKISIKTHDAPIKRIPFKKLRRIIILTTRSSLSTYLIKKCAEEKIDIDFIAENEPYALLTYHKTIAKELHIKQLKLILSPKGLHYTKNLYYAKAKNQRNLLKYFNIRRKNESLQKYIEKITLLIPKIKNAKDSKTIMGIEAQISQLYWNGFKLITNLPYFQRTHKDSKDPINQALNYGYAILYNRIQAALIKEGLNIYYSFLHVTDYRKPTLVFDMIEPFRQPIVDREIISIITKNQTIKQKDGRLTSNSLKLIIQNIQERLASFTKTKFGKTTYLNLIYFEANALKKAIENEDPNHTFFIAKY